MQLHYRYELGFIPFAFDGKRHESRVELTKAATGEHKGVRLRYRPEYIPVREEPEWAQRSFLWNHRRPVPNEEAGVCQRRLQLLAAANHCHLVHTPM
jgi:hypothetical protein